ncbi:MAG: MFS transporter [Aliidongia sp.]
MSNTELGFAFSAFAYPYALFQLVGGWLGDRFGPRRVLIISGVAVMAATVATGLVAGSPRWSRRASPLASVKAPPSRRRRAPWPRGSRKRAGASPRA